VEDNADLLATTPALLRMEGWTVVASPSAHVLEVAYQTEVADKRVLLKPFLIHIYLLDAATRESAGG
jgi:hypothetical protein